MNGRLLTDRRRLIRLIGESPFSNAPCWLLTSACRFRPKAIRCSRSLLLALHNLAVGGAEPDIRRRALLCLRVDYHQMIKNFVAIAAKTTCQDLAGKLTECDLNCAIH